MSQAVANTTLVATVASEYDVPNDAEMNYQNRSILELEIWLKGHHCYHNLTTGTVDRAIV